MNTFPRLLLGAAAGVLLAAPSPSQERSQGELQARRTKKLEKPVFALAAWQTDYAKARAAAGERGTHILAYFTRSYAA